MSHQHAPFRTTRPFMALAIIGLLMTPLATQAADTEETPASMGNDDIAAARALVDAGQFADALPMLRQLDQQSPDNPDVLNLIGFSLRKTGQPADALVYYNKALALNPAHLGANEYLGELYLETHQPALAAERLAVLQKACGDCEEFQDLQEEIGRYKP